MHEEANSGKHNDRLELGSVAVAVCWVGICLAHLGAAIYYTCVAVLYCKLYGFYVGMFLNAYRIGISHDNYLVVATVHFACAIPHALCLAAIIKKALEPQPQCFKSAPPQRSSWRQVKARLHSCYIVSRLSKVKTRISQIFGKNGLFGVNGKWYGVKLIAREFVELSLQTVQAYRMSKQLSSTTLNDMYTGMIIVNCWVTAWIRVKLADNASQEHFFSLIFDGVLDFVSAVGLSLIIVTPYLLNLGWSIGGFWDNIVSDELRARQAAMELTLVFVSTWADLISRTLFAFGMYHTLQDMKYLIHSNTLQVSRTHTSMIRLRVITKSKLFGPHAHNKMIVPLPSDTFNLGSTSARPHSRRRMSNLVTAVFFVWGLVLLVLHLYSRSIPQESQCLLQVRPWGVHLASCYSVKLDCHNLGIRGLMEEVDVIWQKLQRSMTEILSIRHCSSLELPPSLQSFTKLGSLEIYNSSIMKWDSDAAISGTTHPHASDINLVRIMFANGTLPEGLLSTDIPQSLKSIMICVSNLRHLPIHLHKSWPTGIQVAIELSDLTAVSSALIELKPRSLSLFGNPVRHVPAALFELEGLNDLNLGNTSLQELPKRVQALSSTLAFISIGNTFITHFQAWIDPLVQRSPVWAIAAGGTPYCTELTQFLNGNESSFFPIHASDASDSILMDPQEFSNEIQNVLTCVSCFAFPSYPLTIGDSSLGLLS